MDGVVNAAPDALGGSGGLIIKVAVVSDVRCRWRELPEIMSSDCRLTLVFLFSFLSLDSVLFCSFFSLLCSLFMFMSGMSVPPLATTSLQRLKPLHLVYAALQYYLTGMWVNSV
jgi:hypothetical protein